MPTGGFQHLCTKRGGGIERLYMAAVGDIVSAVYDATHDAFTSLTFAQGVQWAQYDFVEGSCSLVERVDFDKVSPSVEHRLSFAFHRADAAALRSFDELAAASAGGVVALVETPAGEYRLVGYSPEFGGSRPLSIEQATLSTGLRTSDPTKVEITLRSFDTSPARPFTGSL